jgi:hypothetical protein
VGVAAASWAAEDARALPILKEIFFGDTRGGGKTDGVLGKWALKEKRQGFNRM